MGPGADEHHLVVFHALEGPRFNQQSLRNVQVTQVAGQAHITYHGAADEGDLAVVPNGRVDDLLNAVHMACEARDDDASRRRAEHGVNGWPDVLLGRREPGNDRIGGVD